MFRGHSRHTLDDKGRLAIPARFQEVLRSKGHVSVMVTSYGNCLWAFGLEEWRAIEDKVAQLPMFDPKTISILYSFITPAVECPLKQGRITIPQILREKAGLQKDVQLIGALKRFEIWDLERWEAASERHQQDFPAAAQAIDI